MHTENSVIYYGSQGQKIKDFCAVPPYVYRSIFSEALIVEPVDLRDLSAFVISSDQGDSVLVPNLESQ